MHQMARRLFLTNTATINEGLFGNPIVIEGQFFNWFYRHLPHVILGAWAVLVLAFQIGKV